MLLSEEDWDKIQWKLKRMQHNVFSLDYSLSFLSRWTCLLIMIMYNFYNVTPYMYTYIRYFLFLNG